MKTKLKLDGLCVCGRDPREDPNDDCERCQLVARIDELTIAATEDADAKQMLRDELAAARAEAGRLRDGLAITCGLLTEASSVMQSFDPMTMTTAPLRYMAENCRLTSEHYFKLALATPAADADGSPKP